MKYRKVYLFLSIFTFAFVIGVFTELTGLRFGASYGAVDLEDLPATIPFNFWSSILLAGFGVWFFSLGKGENNSEESDK